MTGVPVRPAAYVREAAATEADDPGLADQRGMVISLVQDLGWPVPAVYADAGQPGSQLAALGEAIAASRHDAVFATHPVIIGEDLAQIEAFDRLCRQHGVRLRFHWGGGLRDPRMLFDVICRIKRFTVTNEHLRLLRCSYISWDETEFGAPGINPKRPYGNSNVFADIAEILDVPDSEWLDANEELNPDAEWRFLRLHVETAIALQIGLATGEFRSGRYVRGNDWDDNWTRDEGLIRRPPALSPDGLPRAHPLPKTASGTTLPPAATTISASKPLAGPSPPPAPAPSPGPPPATAPTPPPPPNTPNKQTTAPGVRGAPKQATGTQPGNLGWQPDRWRRTAPSAPTHSISAPAAAPAD